VRVAAALLMALAIGCGADDELTPAERADAPIQWEVQFGPGVEHGPQEAFQLSAVRRGDEVRVTVVANDDGVSFSDSSLGAGLYGFRDGEWRRSGKAGTALTAVRELRRGDRVLIDIDVTHPAPVYRALVRVVDDQRAPSVAWVEVPSR
jgi:hypothetical protein